MSDPSIASEPRRSGSWVIGLPWILPPWPPVCEALASRDP